MKQVLLTVSSRSATPPVPVLMWMGDDAKVGDTYIWRKKVCTVTAVYGTGFSHAGAEVRKTERPSRSMQAGVVLDRSSN